MIKDVEYEDHLKKRFISSIKGPILFSAPHSKKLERGGI
jgi:hypothetical protein